MEKTARLKVVEAMPSDVGHGKVRLDAHTRKKLGVSPGDIVEIAGSGFTAAVVWRLRPEDEGRKIVRIDGMVRKNAGCSLGDKVEVRPAEVKNATKVSMAPILTEARHRIQFGQGIEGFVKRGLLKRPLSKGDTVVIPGIALMGGALPFLVISTAPKGIVQMSIDTEVKLREEPAEEAEVSSHISYEDIGGLGDELQRVRELIELPLKHPQLFLRLGIDPPKGVLLHGPPGTGKTLIAKAVAAESGANFYSILGPEIMNKYYGQSEENLRKRFEEAAKNPPAIIFIDEIDSIAPKRGDVHGEVERRVVAQMLTLMDGLRERGRVIVIAATNRVNDMDPALRRPGRFDREILVGVPDQKGRLEILHVHTRGMPLPEGLDLDELADRTHGFVGADLAALCREAAMKALHRYLPDIELDEPLPSGILERMSINMDDFREALKEVEPSAMREVLIEIPRVTWDDVGGLEEVKQQLKEVVEWPISSPGAFERLGIKPPRGVLLFGPPGTGKTLLARAVAHESRANFIPVNGPEMLSRWVGESEKAVREIFRKAKQVSPAIIFFDEIDAIAPMRGSASDSKVTERMVNQLLTSMDGMESMEGVVVIAATNRPDILDRSLLRAGRLGRLLFVTAPDQESRLTILKVHTRDMPLKGVSIEGLAQLTDGYSGADLASLCTEAAIIALREDMGAGQVGQKHFEAALKTVGPSLDEAMISFYEAQGANLMGKINKGVKDDIRLGYG